MPQERPVKQIFVRLEAELVDRLDRYVERLAAEQPGLKPTRSDAIRILLNKGLEAEEEAELARRRL